MPHAMMRGEPYRSLGQEGAGKRTDFSRTTVSDKVHPSVPVSHPNPPPSLSPLWLPSGARRAHGDHGDACQADFSSGVALQAQLWLARFSLLAKSVPPARTAPDGRLVRCAFHRDCGLDRALCALAGWLGLRRHTGRRRPGSRLDRLDEATYPAGLALCGGNTFAPDGSPKRFVLVVSRACLSRPSSTSLMLSPQRYATSTAAAPAEISMLP